MLNFFLSFIFVLSANAVPAPTPDPYSTTGAVCTKRNQDFDELRYPEQIAHCQRNVTYETKLRVYEMYGIPSRCHSHYTIDHFIPLAIGGANAIENLWPEHKAVKATRPRLETDLYIALRNGEMTQEQAIAIVIHEKTHPLVVDVKECR